MPIQDNISPKNTPHRVYITTPNQKDERSKPNVKQQNTKL